MNAAEKKAFKIAEEKRKKEQAVVLAMECNDTPVVVDGAVEAIVGATYEVLYEHYIRARIKPYLKSYILGEMERQIEIVFIACDKRIDDAHICPDDDCEEPMRPDPDVHHNTCDYEKRIALPTEMFDDDSDLTRTNRPRSKSSLRSLRSKKSIKTQKSVTIKEPKTTTQLKRMSSMKPEGDPENKLKNTINEAIYNYFSKSKSQLKVADTEFDSSKGFGKKKMTSFIEFDNSSENSNEKGGQVLAGHEVVDGTMQLKKSKRDLEIDIDEDELRRDVRIRKIKNDIEAMNDEQKRKQMMRDPQWETRLQKAGALN